MADFYQGITVFGLNDLSGNSVLGTPGVAAPATALQIAGSDGTNLRTILTDATGAVVITGSISATNPSVAPTAAAVPASATYIGGNKSGNLVGLLLDASGNLQISQQGTVTVTGTVAVSSVGGTVAVTQSTSPWVVAGNKTNNAAVPGATNVGTLSAVATTAAPTYTDTFQVALSTDLAGNLRVSTGTVTVTGTVAVTQSTSPWVVKDQADGATGAAVPAQTIQIGGSDGTNLQTIRVSTNRTQVVIPADEALASSVSYFSADQGDTQTSVANPAVKPLLSVRTNSAAILFLLRGIEIVGGGQLTRFQLLKNATLTGSTFATSNGNMQIDTAATSFTGGTVVDSGYFASAHFIKSLTQFVTAGTPGDRFTLAASAISGTIKASGSIQWSETAAAL